MLRLIFFFDFSVHKNVYEIFITEKEIQLLFSSHHARS